MLLLLPFLLLLLLFVFILLIKQLQIKKQLIKEKNNIINSIVNP